MINSVSNGSNLFCKVDPFCRKICKICGYNKNGSFYQRKAALQQNAIVGNINMRKMKYGI